MNIYEILGAMRVAADNHDSEIAHFDADSFLMELVQSLAEMVADEEVRKTVDETVFLYNKVAKHYA